jgi:cysteine synthase
MNYPTIEDAIGKTPLVSLQRICAAENARRGNVVLGKLEGNNPAGSVKDRPALSMIKRAEERGEIKPGDTLIEATSGNTGIALAMAAAIRGYRMVLIMPEDRRRASPTTQTYRGGNRHSLFRSHRSRWARRSRLAGRRRAAVKPPSSRPRVLLRRRLWRAWA